MVFSVTWGVHVTVCVFLLSPGNCKDPRDQVRIDTWISRSRQEKRVTVLSVQHETGRSGTVTSEACPHGSLSLADPAEPAESPRALSTGCTPGPHWVPPSPRQHVQGLGSVLLQAWNHTDCVRRQPTVRILQRSWATLVLVLLITWVITAVSYSKATGQEYQTACPHTVP